MIQLSKRVLAKLKNNHFLKLLAYVLAGLILCASAIEAAKKIWDTRKLFSQASQDTTAISALRVDVQKQKDALDLLVRDSNVAYKEITEIKQQAAYIHSVSGYLYVTFDRLLTSDQVPNVRGLEQAMLVKVPLTTNNLSFNLTITKIEYGTALKKVGKNFGPGEVTQIRFILSDEARLIPNQLNTITVDEFDKELDYLKIIGTYIAPPVECSFSGVLHLIVNGQKTFHRNIPRRIIQHSENDMYMEIIVPLNERALNLMYQYPVTFPKDPDFKLRWGE